MEITVFLVLTLCLAGFLVTLTWLQFIERRLNKILSGQKELLRRTEPMKNQRFGHKMIAGVASRSRRDDKSVDGQQTT